MANKQDLPNAMSIDELTEKLDVHKFRNRNWCKSQVIFPIMTFKS